MANITDAENSPSAILVNEFVAETTQDSIVPEQVDNDFELFESPFESK